MLSQQHGIFAHLIQQAGFERDVETNIIVGTEKVWLTFLWVHKNRT